VYSSKQLLAKQLAQLQMLEQLLLEEKDILQQHDPQALINISEQKHQLLLAIENVDKTIGQDVQFQQDKNAGLLSQLLDEIDQVLQRCQEQNTINGHIIEQSTLTVERLKSSLLENHNKSSMTYDSSGKTSGGLSSLNLKA
jgi:flagella synthesis protein FlgN